MTSPKFGSRVPVEEGSSCSSCALSDKCRDPNKSSLYCCTFFVDTPEKGDDPSSRDFLKMMRELVATESVLSDPYNIDDRDAPLAPNFFEWCVGEQFLNADPKPFPWQIELGLHLFNDVCPNPDCSDPEWFQQIPHDCDPMEIPEYLAIRQNGRCPYCHKTRLDYIRAGRENDHNTLVAVVGQRSGKCLVGDTLVQTGRGLVPICEVVEGDEVHVAGSVKPVIATKYSGRKRTMTLTTRMGYEITGTHNHPVLSPTGFEKAESVKTVCISASDIPWPEHPVSPSTMQTKNLLEVLGRCSREDAAAIVSTGCEFVSDTNVIIEYPYERFAVAVQQFLLTKAIICERQGAKIVLAHPFSKRFADTFGLHTPNAQFVARNSATAGALTLNKAECRWLYSMFQAIQLVDPEWANPALLNRAVYFRQVLLSEEATHADVLEAAEVLRGLQTRDEFFKSVLISALKAAGNSLTVWDTVERKSVGHRRDVYDIEVQDVHRFTANGIVVHNSTGIGYPLSYHQHILLKLKNPSSFYRIKSGTILKTTIVGLTFTGAKQNVFDPMIATIDESPWFRTYHSILDDVARRRGEDELYRVKDQLLFYKPAGLFASPASPSRRNLRGKTSVAVVVDEMGHFSENEQRVNISGMEVWRALTRSLNTVRPAVRRLRERGVVNIPPGIAASISSPYEVSDPIMTLYNAARKQKNIYCVLRPTWEANPDITFEDLQDEFNLDPVSSWRDFGCRPPYSAAAFVAGIKPFSNVVQMKRHSAIIQKSVAVKRDDRAVGTSAEIKQWRWKNDSVPTIMAVDAGHSKNAFALCVAHVNSDKELEYDLFAEVRPRHNMPVSFRRTYSDLIVPICKNMNVKVVVGDRWQHIRLMEDLLEDHGVEYIELRLLYAHFQAWRDDLLRGQWKMPRPEMSADKILNIDGEETSYFDDKPVSQFIRQCIRVVDVPGKTVDKPTTGNDDVFRVGVLAHAALGFEEVREALFAADMRRQGGGVGASAHSSGYLLRNSSVGVHRAPSSGSFGGFSPVVTHPDESRLPVGAIKRR